MNYFLSCVRDKYACFTGRARRKEYWMFVLFNFLIAIVAQIIDALLTGGLLVFVAYISLLLPALGVIVRRLHDTDRSGWWILISLIPIIGPIVLLIFMCLEGTRGGNRFGPDPKADMDLDHA